MNANAVGAYNYSNNSDTIANYNSGQANPPPGPYRPALEDFSSTGGNITIYFAPTAPGSPIPAFGRNRSSPRAMALIRHFFPSGTGHDSDNDNFPNFFEQAPRPRPPPELEP